MKKVRRVPYVMIVEIPFGDGAKPGDCESGQVVLADDMPFIVEMVTLDAHIETPRSRWPVPAGLVEVKVVVTTDSADDILWQQVPIPAERSRLWKNARVEPQSIIEAGFVLLQRPDSGTVVEVIFSGYRLFPASALVTPAKRFKPVEPRAGSS